MTLEDVIVSMVIPAAIGWLIGFWIARRERSSIGDDR